MRSPDVIAVRRTPLRPLLAKELRSILGGRALWTMLLIMCPIVGFSFFQALSLYGEASASTSDAPVLASGLSPLDGVLVPTFGAFYVTVTLLFPFVAIRALGREKETGTLRLLVQLPYRTPTLIAAKAAAVAGAWLIALIPAASALVLWRMLGGHLHAIETLNLLVGHLLYGLLIGAVALFAAAIAESAATAAIVTLAVTIGSWMLDFALAGQPGLAEWVSRLSLTQTLRPFEQGLFSLGLVLGSLAAIMGFASQAALWLHPGVPLGAKLVRSLGCAAVTGALVLLAAQVRTTIDVTEDRRNSFPAADQRALAALREPLVITVHLAPEDPRYVDLRRNVLVEARARAAKRHHQAGRKSKLHRPQRRQLLWGGRIRLRRPHRQEPLDQPSRDPAAALRPCGRADPDAGRRRGLSGLSADRQCGARSAVVLRRTAAVDRSRMVVEPPRATHSVANLPRR